MLDADSSPVTHAIIGAAIEVHRHLGPGFLESAYGDALEREFALRAIPGEREVQLDILYKGESLRTRYRADFVVQHVLVELKAQSNLSAIDEAQVLHYLRATGLSVALLVNFGSRSCEIRRFVANGFNGRSVSVDSV